MLGFRRGRLPHCQTAYELELVVDRISVVGLDCSRLLSHLDELGQDVVSSGAMARKLIIGVPLSDVRSSPKQLSDNVQVAAMGSQVQGTPLVHTSSRIHIKLLFFICQEFVKLGNGRHSLVLSFAYGCVKRCPVV